MEINIDSRQTNQLKVTRLVSIFLIFESFSRFVVSRIETFEKMPSKAVHGFRMWMPKMPMILIGARNANQTNPAKATFRVLPKMTKHEVKEYLQKIYNLPVEKVNTQNILGKRMRILGRRIAYRKEPDWKKAIVTFRSDVKDIGIGTRIKELEDLNE